MDMARSVNHWRTFIKDLPPKGEWGRASSEAAWREVAIRLDMLGVPPSDIEDLLRKLYDAAACEFGG